VKRLIFLILIIGCVQPGVQRPNKNLYVIDVPGLSLVDSRSFASSEVFSNDSCFKHDSVILYFSELVVESDELVPSTQGNYVVQLFFNESRTSCLHGFVQEGGVYFRSNLTDQYAWFWPGGLVIVEGTFADLGGEEYNETLLQALLSGYQSFLS